jgi:hypothetical protein
MAIPVKPTLGFHDVQNPLHACLCDAAIHALHTLPPSKSVLQHRGHRGEWIFHTGGGWLD